MSWLLQNCVLQVTASLCGLVLAGAMTGSVMAVQETTRWLRKGPELVEACRDERTGGDRRQEGTCTSYLLGYLDGNAAVALSDSIEGLSRAIAALEPEAVATRTSAQVIVQILDRYHRC
jgi:hypothetical protein